MSYFDVIILHSFEKNGRPATLKERADMRKTCGPYTWKPSEPNKGRGFYVSSKSLACADSSFSLRLVYANDLLPAHARLRDITGYYTDDFQDQTMQPIVARLNHGRGFLIGWTMGLGMCASLEPEIYTDAESAARAAHSHTEYAAENEREYQVKESARIQAEEEEQARIDEEEERIQGAEIA